MNSDYRELRHEMTILADSYRLVADMKRAHADEAKDAAMHLAEQHFNGAAEAWDVAARLLEERLAAHNTNT